MKMGFKGSSGSCSSLKDELSGDQLLLVGLNAVGILAQSLRPLQQIRAL
jgi:hypothetical protein